MTASIPTLQLSEDEIRAIVRDEINVLLGEKLEAAVKLLVSTVTASAVKSMTDKQMTNTVNTNGTKLDLVAAQRATRRIP